MPSSGSSLISSRVLSSPAGILCFSFAYALHLPAGASQCLSMPKLLAHLAVDVCQSALKDMLLVCEDAWNSLQLQSRALSTDCRPFQPCTAGKLCRGWLSVSHIAGCCMTAFEQQFSNMLILPPTCFCAVAAHRSFCVSRCVHVHHASLAAATLQVVSLDHHCCEKSSSSHLSTACSAESPSFLWISNRSLCTTGRCCSAPADSR